MLQWPVLDASDLGALLLYLIMHVIIDIYRIRIQKTTVTLAMAVMLAVLLEYGLLVTLAISLLSLGLGTALTSARPTRILSINASMITLSTLIAGLIFHWMEGVVGDQGITQWGIFSAFVFSMMVLVVNHLILMFLQQGKFRRPIWWSTLEVSWDVGANIASLPLGILLYQTHLNFSWYGLVLFVMPLIAISSMFQLYSQTYNENRRLQRLYQTLAQMAAEARSDRFLRLLRKAVVETMEFRRFQLLEWQVEEQRLVDLENGGVIHQPRWVQVLMDEPQTKMYIQRWPENDDWSDADLDDRETALVIPLRHMTNTSPLVPLTVDQPLGILVVYAPGGDFGPGKTEEELLLTLSQQVSTSLRFMRKIQSRERRSRTDDLTGLSNLRSFQELLNEQVEIAESSITDLSLVLMDIDHFKQVNDVHGHLVGNQVLQQIAQILRDLFPQKEMVCRYGGEEFAVILPKHGAEQGGFAAEQIRLRVEQHHFMISGSMKENAPEHLRITVSVGVATFPQFAKSSVELIRLSDRAMYIGAKRAGRNRVSVFGIHDTK